MIDTGVARSRFPDIRLDGQIRGLRIVPPELDQELFAEPAGMDTHQILFVGGDAPFCSSARAALASGRRTCKPSVGEDGAGNIVLERRLAIVRDNVGAERHVKGDWKTIRGQLRFERCDGVKYLFRPRLLETRPARPNLQHGWLHRWLPYASQKG